MRNPFSLAWKQAAAVRSGLKDRTPNASIANAEPTRSGGEKATFAEDRHSGSASLCTRLIGA
jgi:hypothetical protein